MRVAAHQPNYMPYLGFVKKAAASDVFVIADDDQYTRGSFIDYNFIKGANGPIRLKVPVTGRFGSTIDEMSVLDETGWRKKHLKSIECCYKRARNFQKVYPAIEESLAEAPQSLAEASLPTIRALFSLFEIRSEIVLQSDLNIDARGVEGILSICEELGADTYVSGTGASAYQREEDFAEAGVTLEYVRHDARRYPQLFGGFIPNLSAVDFIMNCDAKDLMLS